MVLFCVGSSEQIRARYVVGCEGPTSAVRGALSIPFEGQKQEFTLSVTVKLKNLGQYHAMGAAEHYLFVGPDGI